MEGGLSPTESPNSVDELETGDHACVTFTDPEERLDVVAAFVGTGLRVGHKVLCLTEAIAPDRLGQEFAERAVPVPEALASGQLTILTSEQSWLGNGAPTAATMIDVLAGQLRSAAGEGYPGLRVSADMVWATRPFASVEQLLVFESEMAELMTDGRLTVICQYDRDSFDGVTLAQAVELHPRTVAAAVYHDDPLLRVCRQYSPPGVRLAGEIDMEHTDALAQALTEALRLDHDVHVNLAALRFIDAGSASTIVRAALSLPPGRTMLVTCQPTVGQLLALTGAHDAPQLRVVPAHG
jgi:anti-anti-sigma factor